MFAKTDFHTIYEFKDYMDPKRDLLDLFWMTTDGHSPTALQRILLVTDGTVTDVIEAYANETISVVKLTQSFGERGEEDPLLDLDGDERILSRSVLLRGTESGTTFIQADSVIACDRLPPTMLDSLLTTERPLGKLLAAHRVETFREIVAVGFVPARSYAEYFGVPPSSLLFFRTYRIHVGGRPLMRISERFPVTTFTGRIDI